MAIYLPEMGTVSSKGDLGEAGPVSQREYHLEPTPPLAVQHSHVIAS